MTTQTSPTLQVSAKKLADALAPIMSLIQERPIVPSLSYVIIAQIGSGVITCTGGSSNQRMHVIISGVDCEDDNHFVTLIEASPFYSLLRTCGDSEVSLVQEDRSLSFITSSGTINFPAISPKDYPQLGLDKATRESTTLDEVSATKLSETLLVLKDFTKQSNEFQSPLAGIWLTNVDGFLRCTAADYAIGQDDSLPIQWSLSEPLFLSNDMIVPFAKMMASGDKGDVLVESRENWIGLNVAEDQLWCRRQSVTTPNLAMLWPADDDKGFTGSWTVDKLPLIQSLKRILSLPGLPAKSGVSHLAEFHTNDGSPVISYNFESYHADEACGDYDGPEPAFSMGMGVDVKKLLVVANSFPGNTLYFSLNPTNERQRVIYVTDEKSNKRALFMLLATNLH